MQTARTDSELQAEMPEDGKERRRIHMPERRTLIVAGAPAGGAAAVGLVIFYYLRKRSMVH
jgi:hypothetical protein